MYSVNSRLIKKIPTFSFSFKCNYNWKAQPHVGFYEVFYNNHNFGNLIFTENCDEIARHINSMINKSSSHNCYLRLDKILFTPSDYFQLLIDEDETVGSIIATSVPNQTWAIHHVPQYFTTYDGKEHFLRPVDQWASMGDNRKSDVIGLVSLNNTDTNTGLINCISGKAAFISGTKDFGDRTLIHKKKNYQQPVDVTGNIGTQITFPFPNQMSIGWSSAGNKIPGMSALLNTYSYRNLKLEDENEIVNGHQFPLFKFYNATLYCSVMCL